jgi:hypothetical protein
MTIPTARAAANQGRVFLAALAELTNTNPGIIVFLTLRRLPVYPGNNTALHQ